jgi:peptide-methionine (S)-S-oxide reductase
MAYNKETIVLGGGCFWCTEAVFKMLKGIISVEPGYAGGTGTSINYEKIHYNNTGYAEVVKVEFDSDIISLNDILTVFFGSHDPTQLNRQGNDVGEEYRSIIFYTAEEQKTIAEEFIKDINDSNKMGKPIVTEVKPLLGSFMEAEDYHKNYYEKHKNQSYCQVIINPKLKKVQEKFADLLNNI